jgi:Polyketide cyclase / dehydrase and lipid transport
MPHLARRRCLCAAAVAGLMLPAAAQEVTAKVERHGDKIVVDVTARVAAPLATTWAVLVDYDHMADYMSNLKTSKVLRRQGNQLEVSQSGETKVAFVRFAFASVRLIELLPMKEIRSQLVSGDFKSFDTLTQLAEVGAETHITYHGEYVPTSWVPPLIGPGVIGGETKRQYGQLLAEAMRRHATGPTPAPAPAASAPP